MPTATAFLKFSYEQADSFPAKLGLVPKRLIMMVKIIKRLLLKVCSEKLFSRTLTTLDQ